jgi:tetratricopeptide (TPR) repeat protein
MLNLSNVTGVIKKLSNLKHFMVVCLLLKCLGMNAGPKLLLPRDIRAANSEKAIAYLAHGEVAEAKEQWELALEHYAMGLSLSPKEPYTAYFLFNNAGRCLNVLGFHSDAESYCRHAIEIDSKRHDGYRNLGIALQAQNNSRGAAWAWVEAIKATPSDPRAAELLKHLLTERPTLLLQCPWIEQELLTTLGIFFDTGPLRDPIAYGVYRA